MVDIVSILHKLDGIRVDEKVSARTLTSYACGGDIDLVIHIDDESAIDTVLDSLNQHDISFFFLGSGTNILVSDSGYKGAFIKLGEKNRIVKLLADDRVYASGGLPLYDFVTFLKKSSLGGLSFLAGIPGSVGGAIVMNAGAYGSDISHYIVKVDAITREGEKRSFDVSECLYGYRESIFRKQRWFVLGGEFRVEPNRQIDAEVNEILRKRAEKHNLKLHYAGSVFKNPPGNYAGKLIDDCGLRGFRLGTAYISQLHANNIISDKGGNASDVMEIMQIAALRVFFLHGIKLEPEIELIGFDFDWNDIFE